MKRRPILNENRRVNFPDGLHDRARDAWRILLSIGSVAGGEWAGPKSRAWRACQHISADAEEETGAREKLLADLWKVFHEAGDPEALPTQQILEDLAAMEGRPWSEWRQGKRLSPRGLASPAQTVQGKPKKHQAPRPKSRQGLLSDTLATGLGRLSAKRGSRIRYCRYPEETKGHRGFSIRYRADGGSGYENL